MTLEQAQLLLQNIDDLVTLLLSAAAFLCFAHGFNSGYQR